MPSYFYNILFVFVCAAAVIGVRGVNIKTHFSRFCFTNFKILFKQEECDPVFGDCELEV